MLKEYGEELFSFELDPDVRPPDYFLSAWGPVAELRAALNSPRRARLLPTGLALNLINLRWEICTLLLVDDDVWWRKQAAAMKVNWE
ncbi:MAG: hypothetical protein KKB20_17225 [Proteobacteria bacterium]|nr:hypothetical protein [Pseudomonadota bacterium]